MAEKDLYKILHVPRTASDDEIRTAYRKLARKYHPDVNAGDSGAEERFKEISAANDVLGDPEKRKLYDEFGEASLRSGFDVEAARNYQRWAGGMGGPGARQAPPGEGFSGGFDFGFGDAFGDIFARRSRQGPQTRRGRDVTATVQIDLPQSITGTEVKLRIPGRDQPVTVRIPAGADDGSRLRVEGMGAPGPMGGAAGDLIIETHITPHPYFERDGLDLVLKLPITLEEAYTGASVEVPTPDGNVTLRVPPRSQSSDRLRLRNKGVRRGEQRGDMYVELQVKVPDRDDPEVAEALRLASRAYTGPLRADLRL